MTGAVAGNQAANALIAQAIAKSPVVIVGDKKPANPRLVYGALAPPISRGLVTVRR